MNHDDKWLEMADLHALGALGGAERGEFDAHLKAGCALCDARVAETADLLAAAAAASPELAVPSPAVKQKLLLSLGLQAAARPRITQPAVWASAAVVLGIAAAIGMFLRPAQPLHSAEMAAVLADPQTRVVNLLPAAGPEPGNVALVWNPKACRGCFHAQGMSAAAPGKEYQLWAIRKGHAPVSVGTFRPDAAGNAHADFPELTVRDLYDTFAITLEPAGGVPQPTGAIRLAGRF